MKFVRAVVLALCFAILAHTPSAFAGAIDINSASMSELDSLPGIGPSKAQAIIDYRTKNGPFAAVSDITKVPGIGDATLANIKSLIVAGKGGGAAKAPAPAPAPSSSSAAASTKNPCNPCSGGKININKASAKELESLPGIGATKAAAIVADRTKNGPYASCNDLTRVTGIGAATVQNIAGRCATK